jgi:hypothetical protein
MWYFGVLLYQLCTLDGETLWKVDQADNISKAEMLDLAFRWVSRRLVQQHSFLSTILPWMSQTCLMNGC